MTNDAHIPAADDTGRDCRKPWITPEIKELADAQDAQGGARLGINESIYTPYAISYRPS